MSTTKITLPSDANATGRSFGREELELLEEVIASSPAMVENCFSRGVATAAAIVWGLAPGRPAETVIVG